MLDIIIRELQSTDSIPWSLFLLADPLEAMIKRYFPGGNCYVALSDDQIIGEYIILQKENAVWELMNMAVEASFQGKGIGQQLLSHAIVTVKTVGGKKLEVGTGNSSTQQLHFYQKNGFHIARVEKNFFTKNYPNQIIENGIVCKDKIILSMNL